MKRTLASVVLLSAALLTTGCQIDAASTNGPDAGAFSTGRSQPSASAEHKPVTHAPVAPSTAAATTPASGTSPVVAHGHGWTSQGLDGPMPAVGTCHVRTVHGVLMPSPRCTMGAIDPTVNESNLDRTLGRSGGYTAAVRPPEAMTERAKRKLFAAYGIPWSQVRDYELDHLIPLCLSGASDVRNLWPEKNVFEPGTGAPSSMVHNSKDRVEDYLCSAARQHKVSLAAAQKAIAGDWTTAVRVVGLPPIPAGYRG